MKTERRGLAINLGNFISPCLQGLYPRVFRILSSSISTLTILSPCAAFMFVLFAFSCVLIAPVPVVCKSKIQCLLLFPRSFPVLILFVFVSVCVVWLCPSFDYVLLCCLQLCYFWPTVVLCFRCLFSGSGFPCWVQLYRSPLHNMRQLHIVATNLC